MGNIVQFERSGDFIVGVGLYPFSRWGRRLFVSVVGLIIMIMMMD